jgi:hypothetical protein
MSKEQDQGLSTADFAAAGEARHDDTQQVETRQSMPEKQAMPEMQMQQRMDAQQQDSEPLAALFAQDVAHDFRSRWDAVQIGFVDDPRRAVQQADELVAQVMKSLAETFAQQRASIEAEVGQADQASTENLRVALRRYRSFFQRLLSL